MKEALKLNNELREKSVQNHKLKLKLDEFTNKHYLNEVVLKELKKVPSNRNSVELKK